MPKKIRVWNLYRVSTKAQLTNDEIPTQKTSCMRYIDTQPDWSFEKEVSENGVSAFKNQAIDREILNNIMEAAKRKEFDILLVYKGDRLGRLFMDTSLFLTELFRQGVKTYSTVEHYLNVETHAARLTTSIIFWQSEGESIGTSQRVTDFMKQYNEEGKYMGGTPPYGYKVVDTGVDHWKKKDKTIKKFAIDEQESIIVKEIFDLVHFKGFGGERIANYLNDNGYKSRSGGQWRSNVIVRLLRNHIYVGLKRYNIIDKSRRVRKDEDVLYQPKDESLVIIDEAVFWNTQKLLNSRLTRELKSTFETSNNPTSSIMLFTGIVKCGYCGSKLKADYSVKSHTKVNGEVSKYKVTRYTCNNGKDNTTSHEVKYFSAKKFEEQAEEAIIKYINGIDEKSLKGDSKKFINQTITKLNKELSLLKNELQKKMKELENLKLEVMKVIMGESKFDSEMLQDIISKKEKEVREINERIKFLDLDLKNAKIESTNTDKVKEELFEWKTKYPTASIDEKKMLYSKIIKVLTFKKDNVTIEMDLPFTIG